ncbi:MAG: hypothetical protein O9338_18500 [Microcystis sp. LE19-251.1A]|nr:hypothetical protein [Microcystis sp. LE19-251.1A]MDJ0602932.1 hypothetical protein [Microcystis sp. M53602_WE12]
MKIGKTLHPTPHTPHPNPTNKLFQQTLLKKQPFCEFPNRKPSGDRHWLTG